MDLCALRRRSLNPPRASTSMNRPPRTRPPPPKKPIAKGTTSSIVLTIVGSGVSGDRVGAEETQREAPATTALPKSIATAASLASRHIYVRRSMPSLGASTVADDCSASGFLMVSRLSI
jgi:hypothetical protein